MNYLIEHLPLISTLIVIVTTLYGFVHTYWIKPIWDKHKEVTLELTSLRLLMTEISTKLGMHAEGSDTFRKSVFSEFTQVKTELTKLQEDVAVLENLHK